MTMSVSRSRCLRRSTLRILGWSWLALSIFLLFVVANAGAAPPVTSMTSFSEVSETEATLQASVDPKSLSTKYHFDYVDQAGFEASGFSAAFHTADATIPIQVKGTGTLQSGSSVVTNVTVTTGGAFGPGQALVAGGGIPAGTTIKSVSGSELVLSKAATASGPI